MDADAGVPSAIRFTLYSTTVRAPTKFSMHLEGPSAVGGQTSLSGSASPYSTSRFPSYGAEKPTRISTANFSVVNSYEELCSAADRCDASNTIHASVME